MKRCTKCYMPDTRPGSIFNEDGVCKACINYEERKTVNWAERKKELKKLCDKYRRDDGYYDCIVPVSGGKDSHMLVYRMKVEMGMNPLLITIGDPFTKTEAGAKNYRNLGDTFNCDHILFDLSLDLFRRVTRIAFEETGEVLKFVEAAIYTVPLKMAVKFNIPLVVFGENSAFEYGITKEDTYSANEYIFNIFEGIDLDFWLKKGISRKEMNAIIPPTKEDLKRVKPEVTFMSYFVPWSSMQNLRIAKRYGFRDLYHEWQREGYYDHFEQIDSIAYMIHHWMKYPKFGFNRPTDIASRFVREDIISLDKAKELMKDDWMVDQRALDDFCEFCGYTAKEFWDVVEKYWNRDIFEKVDGVWQRKASEEFMEEKSTCEAVV